MVGLVSRFIPLLVGSFPKTVDKLTICNLTPLGEPLPILSFETVDGSNETW